MACLINGLPADAVSVQDRGLNYGDGVFTTVACRAGRPLLWQRHLARLARDADRLGLAVPDAAALTDEMARLLADTGDCIVKVVHTRGSGGRGYRPPEPAIPTRILLRHPWPAYPQAHYQSGISARLCRTRLGENPALAGIKHLNRLEQVLARGEWHDPDIAEGVMLSASGYVIEGTMSNVFLVREGALVTPDLSRCGVAGVMREWLLQLGADLGMAPLVRPVPAGDLVEADEMFVCNSVLGIWPVRWLDGHEYAAPGPVTRQLQRALTTSGEWVGHHGE